VYDLLAIVVNYNSRGIIDIERRLLQGLDRLNNAVSLKLVLVDNYSTDGSFEDLYMYVRDNLNLEIIPLRLSKNYGFARAVNIAYRYATKRWKFKYLAILNNDLVIVPESIPKLLGYLEYGNIAGVQGTIMQMQNPHLIDNAGFLIDQYGLTYPVCRNYTIDCARLYAPSYLSGACSFYRIDAINKIGGRPFDDAIESYYDDKYLGLYLWNVGYRLLHIPVITAYHLGTFSYSEPGLRMVKGPRWFKGIVMADVIPSKIFTKSATLVELFYLIIAISIDLFALHKNFVKSYVEAIKLINYYVKNSHRPSTKIEIHKIPRLPQGIWLTRYIKGVKLTNKKLLYPGQSSDIKK